MAIIIQIQIATKPVYRLQIRPIVHNQRAPLPFPEVTFGSVPVRIVAWECGEGQTDRHGFHTHTHTHTHTDTHTDARDQYTYISPRLRLTRNVINNRIWRTSFTVNPYLYYIYAKKLSSPSTLRISLTLARRYTRARDQSVRVMGAWLACVRSRRTLCSRAADAGCRDAWLTDIAVCTQLPTDALGLFVVGSSMFVRMDRLVGGGA